MSRRDRKAETREAILDSAVRLLRERGPGGASVAEVMKGAGLTVGGFYAHFGSKEELMEEALRRSGRLARDLLVDESYTLEDLVNSYLDEGRCPLPATVASLLTDPEAQPRLREAASASVDRIVVALTKESGGDRQKALATFATLLGGLSLARALGPEDPLSAELVAACKRLLLRGP